MRWGYFGYWIPIGEHLATGFRLQFMNRSEHRGGGDPVLFLGCAINRDEQTMETHRLAILIIIAASLLLAVLLYPVVPETIPTHWNLQGEPDAWSGKAFGLVIIPLIIILTAIIFTGILAYGWKRRDPMMRTTGWFIVLILALLLGIQIYAGLAAAGSDPPARIFFPIIFALFYLGISILLPRLSTQNPVFGIRTPWTMKSPIVWERTHQAGARTFRIAAGLTLLGAFFPDHLFLFIIGSALGATVWLFIVSYREYRRLETDHE